MKNHNGRKLVHSGRIAGVKWAGTWWEVTGRWCKVARPGEVTGRWCKVAKTWWKWRTPSTNCKVARPGEKWWGAGERWRGAGAKVAWAWCRVKGRWITELTALLHAKAWCRVAGRWCKSHRSLVQSSRTGARWQDLVQVSRALEQGGRSLEPGDSKTQDRWQEPGCKVAGNLVQRCKEPDCKVAGNLEQGGRNLKVHEWQDTGEITR